MPKPFIFSIEKSLYYQKESDSIEEVSNEVLY